MPVIFRYKGCNFFFFSNEGIPREPIHIHVRKGEALAKVWVKPFVQIEDSFGFSSRELKEILSIVTENKELIERKWNEYFSE